MSQGADRVQLRSCLNSVLTPNTFKSGNSQVTRLSQMSKSQLQFGKHSQTYNWYKSDPFANDYNPKGKQKDIYSVFSKQTQQSYQTIQSRTVSRMDSEK